MSCFSGIQKPIYCFYIGYAFIRGNFWGIPRICIYIVLCEQIFLLKGRKLSVWKWQKMLREVCLANYSLTFLDIDKAMAANALWL